MNQSNTSEMFRQSVYQFRQAFRMFSQAAPNEPLPMIGGIDGMLAIKLSATVVARGRYARVEAASFQLDPLQMRVQHRALGLKFDRFQFDYMQNF
jgi:DTW domain-containing protein YfiP